jgi:AraC-like DNA-binding protein
VLTTVEPTTAVLRRYVDLFYFFTSDSGETRSHIAFPHVNTAISFFKAVSLVSGDHHISVRGSAGAVPIVEMLGKYTQPVYVTCEGAVDEVAIVFKPLGVNRFLRESFGQVAPEPTQRYHNEQWRKFAEVLFLADDRIAVLEQFLLSLLCEDDRFIEMEEALSLLECREQDFSVAEVAAKLSVNLKTFQRNFTKMLACSPSDYKRIARFRSSLRSKLLSSQIKSLTSITYEHNYTDQSYFIREFRKLTNQNPKLFFKEVTLVDGDKIAWEIL